MSTKWGEFQVHNSWCIGNAASAQGVVRRANLGECPGIRFFLTRGTGVFAVTESLGMSNWSVHAGGRDVACMLGDLLPSSKLPVASVEMGFLLRSSRD